MNGPRTVLFLCPHHAAKSVLAAVDFRTEAARRGVDLVVDSAGTEPSEGPLPAVVAALRADGIDIANHRPRAVTAEDLAGAWRIVSLGCDPDAFAAYADKLERWDDVPAASLDVTASRAAIRRRLARFLDDIAAELAALDRWENEGGAA